MMDISKTEIPALPADATTLLNVVPASERGCVLIVDDTPSKLMALGAIVSGMGLDIMTANSGEQALRQLLKRDYAVILLDVNMPMMDGFETATLIRSRPRSEHTPIIFVTAEANSEADRMSGYTLGAVDFIYSPIIPEILRAKVRVFVDLFYLQRQLLLHVEELKARQQELANSNQVLNGLYRIAEGLNRAVSEQEVAEAALELALELPGVQAGWISLREGESGFRLAATRNLPPALEAPGALEGDCLCRRQLFAGELGAVNILECERLGKTKGDTRGLRHHASVPLWLGDRMVGVMNLIGPQEGAFTEEALKVLHGVGQQVVVALDRARLHEHLESLVVQRTAALTEEIVERKRAEEKARLEGLAKARLRHAFTHYLASDVIEEIIRDPERLRLGGERRKITAFFSDVKGFTGISESLDPAELVVLLNECLSGMADIILQQSGIIDKYIGDSIVAMFGAPQQRPDHPLLAVQAAMRCQARLAELRIDWQKRGLPGLQVRIGLNSGTALVGNMGSQQRFDFTMLGDMVNLASRLEGAANEYGVWILIGETTADAVQDQILLRQLDVLLVKGKLLGVRVYEPLATLADATPAQFALVARFADARTAYSSKDFVGARAIFEEIAAEFDDEPARRMVARIDGLKAHDLPSDWDETHTMTYK